MDFKWIKKIDAFTIIGLIASIGTLVQVTWFFIVKDPTLVTENIIAYSTMGLALITVSCLLASESRKASKTLTDISEVKAENETFKRDIKTHNQKIESLAKYNHNINHIFRDTVFSIYGSLYEDYDNPEEALAGLSSTFKQFLSKFTTNVKETFDIITNDNSCSVYISSLLTQDTQNGNCNSQTLMAKTFYRDPTSHRERNAIDKQTPIYDINQFTPFKNILDISINCRYFVCDDCSRFSNFKDRTLDWNKFYSACLCVPVRVPIETNNRTIDQTIGFIVVDNKKGGFAHTVAIELLCSYADLLYIAWSIFADAYNSLMDDINDKNE